MSNHPRPVLLGYIRADVLPRGSDLPAAEAALGAFANREEFSLGTVYVHRGPTGGAFDALLAELSRQEAAWAVVVPDLRHVTDEEHQVLRRHQEDFVRPALLVASHSPLPVALALSPRAAPGSPLHSSDAAIARRWLFHSRVDRVHAEGNSRG